MDGRYIVGVDGSSPSDAAVAWAVQRARRDGAPIVLAHVRDPEAGMMGEDFARDEERRGTDILRGVLDGLVGSGLAVSMVVLDGPLPWALAQAVTVHDVVVVGTHKIGFLHGRVLGSRSVQVAATVPCTVTVVPEVDLRFRRGVVAGIDREETAAAIARAAAAEADARGEELVIVQSVRKTRIPRSELPLATAVAAARAAYPSLQIRSRVSERPPAEALLDAARDKALLVLGPGSTDAARSPIGSVLHDVLLNVNAPVLVARPADARQLVGPVASSTRRTETSG